MSDVITLTGPNSFLLQAALNEQVAGFVSQHGDMAVERIDGEEATYDRMREALESLPFLAAAKLVILRNPAAQKQFAEQAAGLLGNLPESTGVIIIEPKLDKRSSYYKYLHAATDFREFKELDENGLARWLAGEVRQAGGSISPADARYLVSRVGTNQRLLANEVAKLLDYDTIVTRQTIDELVEATPQSSIFDLLDAAFSGNLGRAMALYDEQRRLGLEPQQLVAMIAWQLHIFAVLKAAGRRDPATVASDARLSPYVVRKSSAVARSLQISELKSIIREVLTVDRRLKSEPIDADEALKNVLIKIARL